MDQLVRNLLAAYKGRYRYARLDDPETKQKAQKKRAKFATKIGYPLKWRDYSALQDRQG